MKVVCAMLWVLAMLGSALGFLALLAAVFASQAAPQQVASAAIAVALPVIPYCFAHARSEIGGYLARLETGRHEPTLTTLGKLAKALRVKLTELLR